MGKVEFYRHALNEQDADAVGAVLQSVFLTTGPRTAEFEQALAEYLGVHHVVGVSSCTAALFLSLTALGIGAGDEVITTPMTFIATSNAIIHTGATPVFVDVEPTHGNIDVSLVEAAITDRTKAVMPVHLYGVMVDLQPLRDICNRHGLRLIEDAAHSVEAERSKIRPGHLGDTACFSFYATKNMTCGEGGAVATNDDDIADRLRRMRLHGMSKSAADRYTGAYHHWDMTELGYKANMFDIQAAMLIGQLARLDEQLARREEIAQQYESEFSNIAGVDFPQVPNGARSARHLFTIWVAPHDRDHFLKRLQDQDIGVAVNYRAVHLLQYYREQYRYQRGSFPIAERIGDSTITLPLYPRMYDQDVELVIRAVRRAVESA